MAELITIGITAFNAAATIERAVRSALEQTWRPAEILIVDDCSEDATMAILTKLCREHPEIRLIRQEKNRGIAATRNRILAEAKGEFVAFFDDDDESLPERVEAQLRRIVAYERDFAHGAPVICHTARLQLYPDGSRRIAPTMGEREGHPAPAGPAVAERILLGKRLKDAYGACATCSQMARLSTYASVGGFDPALARSSDTDLNIRLALAGAHFPGIAQPLVLQTMTKTPEKSLGEEHRNTVVLLDKHRGFVEDAGGYEFSRRWIDAKQAWLEGRSFDFARQMATVMLLHPILSMSRLALALPNFERNRAFSRFHLRGEK
ncbi:MAG: glycosyltransferase family 2 protein [Methyloceanibacter sp.]